MATDEFEQTGRTSGQRIFAENQTKPRGQESRFGRAAERFVTRIMDGSPDTLARLRSPGGATETPEVSPFDDLSDDELRRVITRVAVGADLDESSARELSRFLSGG